MPVFDVLNAVKISTKKCNITIYKIFIIGKIISVVWISNRDEV